ncbi:1-acyl-sn-glycerol-3-phosphate acyltransferase [Pontixanthobacter aestiaquae]|uniref:Acyltransferase n=1 Tax=Pontixanthobacter aestiaquae TaxID=1509367 RepID=A0A844Z343_9SPHN|nr:1-acyl-sn-glycerol-3-phosphate acyltransferase [Pontixanthobacter aestiaquae]MDN3646662.1 1-acyl-sn-glycerol-3-phosphate acyltransferase [Pontixanthobacter aestiaquae]MXO82355.1 acyltransferase [Pontixanthobacter aestiaquae]
MTDATARAHHRAPSLLSRIVRRIIIWIYNLKGWKIDGGLPKDLDKYVIAGAPHTSNWDFVFFAGATEVEGVRPNFMGKHTLFKGIMRNFMFDMGGIPIDRTKRMNVVEQVAEEYAKRDELALVIAVEGSRTTDGSWKSGFYNIAMAAKVPIVAAWVCNERNVLGFSDPFWPTGNYGEDLAKIAAFMRSKLPDFERYKVLEAQAKKLIQDAKA